MPLHERAFGRIEDTVVIARSVEDVFAFYQDFRNLPQFLGDVMRVEIVDTCTSRWTIRAPFGVELRQTVVITDMRPNAFIAYRTKVPVPVRWEVRFLPGTDPCTTLLRETMTLPGGPVAASALAAFGKPPRKEVRANLERLKELLETGRVTTLDYAVAGKFRRISSR